MNKLISSLVKTAVVYAVAWPVTNLNAQTSSSSSKVESVETFNVMAVPTENGSYTISPKIPDDGKVPAGTVLSVKAKPASGYSVDAVYYTVKGGMWGTTSHESFSPIMKIPVTRDMKVGVTFIPSSLVDNVKVTQDVVYAKPGVKPSEIRRVFP